MTRRRLILFLVLNVLVSATVTGIILFLHDRFGPPACSGGLGEETGVIISGVRAAGTVDDEAVTVQNGGEDPVVLTGWVLQDGDGTMFTFPQLTLYPGGTVQVHSGEGDDTVTDLYWSQAATVWESGELAVLYDPRGLARAFHRIP